MRFRHACTNDEELFFTVRAASSEPGILNLGLVHFRVPVGSERP